MAVYSFKKFVHSLKNAINTMHKTPNSNNQSSFITLILLSTLPWTLPSRCAYNKCRLREVLSLLYFKKKGELVTRGSYNELATITGPAYYMGPLEWSSHSHWTNLLHGATGTI
jgi:hypothetical protein